MASQQLISEHREGAEIVYGGSTCKQKARELLGSMNLPKGLLPLDNMTEFGYNKTTGFVWFKTKEKVNHKFQKIGKTTTYCTEVTAFIENRRMSKIKGVKSKEFLISISVADMYVKDEDPSKIYFATSSGFSNYFPVAVFEED